jgi:hypothetical protein
MKDDQLPPDTSADLGALAPRFDALGLGDIAARLRALIGAEPPTQARELPVLGPLLSQQLLSILDQTEQA